MAERVTIKTVRKRAKQLGMWVESHNGRFKVWHGWAARDFHEGGALGNYGSAREADAFLDGWQAREDIG